MENASKALIIAGSILLSILIIALGMYIFSTSSSTSDVEILNETEIQAYNGKFEKYKGSQLGSNVKSLIAAIRSNATTNKGAKDKVPSVSFQNEGESSMTTIVLSSNAGKTNVGTEYIKPLTDNLENKISDSHRYTVKLEYGDSGLINAIKISY